MHRRLGSSTINPLLFMLATIASLGAQERQFVYISNVTGTTSGGRPLTTIAEQTAEALDRLGVALRQRGLEYRHVVAVNVFLKDARHFQDMNTVYRRYFQSDPPTRATAQVDLPDPDALIQLSVVATRNATQVITPPDLAAPALPYSWGIKVGNTLFISGATSRSPSTYEPVLGDVPTQTRRVLGNIGLVLKAAGMEHKDLTSCRVYLADPRRFGSMNQAYAEFVPAEDPPARATVRAGLMNPAFDVEIQCVAESSSNRSVVIGEGQQRSRSPLSPAISTGNRLYLSGMLSAGPDVAAQTRSTLDNLLATLRAAGMDFANVVDTWVYVTDIRQWDAIKQVLDQVLPAGSPEPTVIGTPLMGSNFLVEIQMIAER
ncbi:MAG TPA: RidA family protein [Gemmatimonadales bacterium]|nr:RidA family protein [Gemmatimonadales bacterium]